MKILENEIGTYPRVGDKYRGETITSVHSCKSQSLCQEQLGVLCRGGCTLRNRESSSSCVWNGDRLNEKYEIVERKDR